MVRGVWLATLLVSATGLHITNHKSSAQSTQSTQRAAIGSQSTQRTAIAIVKGTAKKVSKAEVNHVPSGAGSSKDAPHQPISDLKPFCGTFPFADNCRDPNKAWSLGAKIAFLTIWFLAWLLVVVLAKYWSTISTKLTFILGQESSSARIRSSLTWPLGQPSGTDSEVSRAKSEPSISGAEVNVGPTSRYPSDRCAHQLFEDRVTCSPNAVALIVPRDEHQPRSKITYQALAAMIQEFATCLNTVGVGHQGIAALSLKRSVGQIVAVFGSLKSGAAYLPMDPELPISRKEIVLSDSEAGAIIAELGNAEIQSLAASRQLPMILLAQSGAIGRVDTFGSNVKPQPQYSPRPSDMAMLIYTSGTTGTPKGIVYDHKHLMHGNYFFGDLCETNEKSIALLKSPYFWAVIEYEMFPALTRGGSLVVASAIGHKSPDYLAQVIAQEHVTDLMMTPSQLDMVLDIHEAHSTSHARPLQSLKHVVTVGEPMPCSLANRFVRTPGVTASLTNMYGASESSCTMYTVPKKGIDLSLFPNKAPAGVPQPHVKVYVIQSQQAEDLKALSQLLQAPMGEAGEIFFGGVLAAGYFKRDELTRERFFDHEVYGPLYRTGDLGRWVQGNLEVLGRTDRQVKIHGVRVEPEEVESVLKRFKLTTTEEGQNALAHVAVLASPEPAELVAFVSQRGGITGVTSEQLKAHCVAALAPAYVPKFFVILQDFPCFANGKPDLPTLKTMAAKHVEDAGTIVQDSLGQMRALSRTALLETQVMHRCYAFWMVGVVCDHWKRCAFDSAGPELFPFCTALATTSVPPWTEMLVRTFGNDQDLFGFIMLGALQDSRPGPDGQKRINFGSTDLFIFTIYMMMAMPFPHMMHAVFQDLAWPIQWSYTPGISNADAQPQNLFGWDYMKINSNTSSHRWYLLMVVQARFLIYLGEKMRCPGWLQVLLVIWPVLLPDEVTLPYHLDGCSEHSTVPIPMQYILSWVFRNLGDGCPVYYAWVWWYIVFYIAAYHFMRPGIKLATRYLPNGPAWAAMSVAASMTLGLLMGMLHYPNDTLETGIRTAWTPLEVSVDFIQPALFALGMTWLPLDMSWWGNTTLGCYCFHYYFTDHVNLALQKIGDILAFDPTGMLTLIAILGCCMTYTTVLGPVGHYILLGPTFLFARVKDDMKSVLVALSKDDMKSVLQAQSNAQV